MTFKNSFFIVVSVVIGTVWGCGELERMDDNGSAEVHLVPSQIQNIFNDQCAFSGCHAGSSPQEGLNLSQSVAYNNLVDVPSSQQSSIKRIAPGQPDNSYLVMKIEGAVGIDGDRMPADGPPYLTASQIDSIRLWISNGAQPR